MTKYLTLVITTAVALSIYSCTNSGFKQHPSGLQYKFINQQKNTVYPKTGDIVAIKLKYTDQKGNIIEESDLFRTQLKKPSHAGGCIEDALSMMSKGDSAVFLINAEDYYTFSKKQKLPKNINPTEILHFYIKMVDIINTDQFEKERQIAKISDANQEDKLLQAFISRSGITTEPTASGLYYIETTKGKGKKPQPGKKVTVHYNGYFIDGQIFDNSYQRNEPFTFYFGVGQVIQGWDEGIAKMNVGSKAKLIIHSSLAYGQKGSGPIPPNTTLVFDIELIDAE